MTSCMRPHPNTGVFLKRRKLDTDRRRSRGDRAETGVLCPRVRGCPELLTAARSWEKGPEQMPLLPPGAPSPALTPISDCQPPGLGQSARLLF